MEAVNFVGSLSARATREKRAGLKIGHYNRRKVRAIIYAYELAKNDDW
jgi:hypothetical protein